MRNLTLVFFAGVALLAGCNEPSPTPTNDSSTSSLKLGEGVSTSDRLSVTNGNVILNEGQAGMAFAFVTAPGRKKEFTYFVVFNHDFPEGGISTKSGGDGSDANGSHTITAFGNVCKLEYAVTLNPDTKTIKTESTSVAGKHYDREKGKLFLVDMNATPLNINQLDLELPSEIPDLEKPDAAEKFGQEILDALRKTDVSVDEFVQRIEK